MKTKTKRSDEIKAEMEKGAARMAELEPQLAERKQEFENAKAAMLEKKITSEEALQAKYAFGLVEELIGQLAQDRERLTSELESALAIEARAETVEAMKELTVTRRTSYGTVTNDREAVNNACSQLLFSKAIFDGARVDFIGHLRTLVPDFNLDQRWPLQMQGKRRNKDLDALLEALDREGVTREDLGLMLGVPEFPSLEHDSAIQEAQNFKARVAYMKAQREREDRKDRIASETAERNRKAAEEREEEMKLLAVKQQRGWKLQNALR